MIIDYNIDYIPCSEGLNLFLIVSVGGISVSVNQILKLVQDIYYIFHFYILVAGKDVDAGLLWAGPWPITGSERENISSWI